MSKSKSRLLSELTGSDGSVDGRDVSADGTKLDGIANNANNYTHPTGDGNLHVPATSTNNDGKILTAGSTAGSISWQDAPVSLPAQSTHNGKFLTTNGTAASWADVDALPDQTGNNGKFLTTDGSAASWVDNDTTVSKVTYEYTATAGQTTFSGADNNGLTLAYTSGNTLVTYGGFDLPFSDFTATNGTSVVLTDGAEVGKIVRIIAFETFDVANTYTQAETDAGFVAKDSSGNVGIGTSSPASPIDVSTGQSVIANFRATTAGGGNNKRIRVGSGGDNSYIDASVDSTNAATNLDLKTGNATRMRIDSSGNVLVGKTVADNVTQGVRVYPTGRASIVSEADTALIVNRRTSDGTIAEFRKDGTNVGRIGVAGGDLAIGTGDAGLKFRDEFDCIQPHNMSTNVTTDGVLSLGKTGVRFKDLYLSGGVYLGGTGSANKLDDYEEGTWTPTLKAQNGTKTWTYSGRSGKYIKVGNIVTAWFSVQLSSNGSGTDGNAYVDGLPFTSANDFSVYSLAWKQLIETGDVGLMLRLQHTHSHFFMIDGSSSYPDIEYINTSVLVNDRRFRGQFTYQTS